MLSAARVVPVRAQDIAAAALQTHMKDEAVAAAACAAIANLALAPQAYTRSSQARRTVYFGSVCTISTHQAGTIHLYGSARHK